MPELICPLCFGAKLFEPCLGSTEESVMHGIVRTGMDLDVGMHRSCEEQRQRPARKNTSFSTCIVWKVINACIPITLVHLPRSQVVRL